ncbi:MAG TPA: ABC transporter transmembrane domain-containing protein [Flavobacteriales bacterium]|nr:ABC transporter transmembrane domain-containing protein [Flavobacteriales bacterium]
MAKEREKIKLTKESYRKAMRVFTYMRPYRGLYIISLIFLVLSSATSMLFPLLMGNLLGGADDDAKAAKLNDPGFDITDLGNTNAVALLLFIVFGSQAIFSFFRIYFGTRVVESVTNDLRNDAYSKMVSMPMDFFNRNKVGELSSRISSDIMLIQETLAVTITEFFRQILTVIICIVALAFISIKLSLIMLAVIPVLALIAVFWGRYIRKMSKAQQDRIAESNQVVEETLTGIVGVKAFTNEYFERSRYNKLTGEAKRLAIKNSVSRGFFIAVIMFCMFSGITYVIWNGANMVQTFQLSESEFFSFLFYTLFIGISFGSIPELFSGIQKTVGGTEKLMDLIDQPTESVNISTTKNSERILKGKLTFENVSFSYPTRPDMQVLNNVSFSVNPGQQLALVGSSGSGKSTIVSLLLQFYHEYSGNIKYDDKNASEYDLTELRNHMALVPQEVILFSGTIRDNISYGKPGATLDEIKEAARQANALDFINSFPDGFDTLVGNRGIQLSGGQKQRIAIARAVLKDPVILLLDEATSSLDSESERLVQDALDKLMKGRTTVVVAHRLSTVRNVDMILVFDHGQIIEQGSHSDLLARDGKFNKLYSMQMSI